MANFIEEILAGNAKRSDIDDWIEEWHKGNSHMKLHEYLGMNRREYAVWLTAPTQDLALDIIVNKHRAGTK